jgi:hypothetical protein
VTTAFGAHLASGGEATPPLVAAAFVVCGAVAWSLAARRLTGPQLLGLLILCQTAVHVAAMSSGTGEAAPMGAVMLAAHVLTTLVSWAALVRGEAFAWSLAQHLALRPMSLVLRAWQPPGHRSLAALVAPEPVRHGVWSTRATPVRGPPMGIASAPIHVF